MSKTIIIHHGRNVTVKIFRTASKHVAKDGTLRTYTSHVVRWTDLDGIARELKRNKLADARREADAKAEQIAKGSPTTELSQADVASFKAAVGNLFGTGKRIEVVTADFAEGHKLAPDQSHAELARHWKATQPRSAVQLTTTAAVESLVEAKRLEGQSNVWIDSLASQLGKFTHAFPGTMSEVTAAAVKTWHLKLKVRTRGKKGVTVDAHPRTKNNHLGAVQLLFTMPELRNHPEREAILDLQPCNVPESENEIWQPSEFKNLLETALLPFRLLNKRNGREEAHSHEHLIAPLVLGGFCKLRSSEIRRVHWEKIRLDEARLRLRVGQTKTQHGRTVPLPECAVAWLRLVAQKDGLVWPWARTKFNKDLVALARRCGFQWRENSLRNSASTYDHMLDPDSERVSKEAGNSVSVLEREYLATGDDVTVADAKAWFAILPPRRDAVIVPMQG